jgi:hypothetical protein
MNGRIPARAGKLTGAILAAVAAMAITAGAASAETEVVYNNLPASKPGNVVSEAFEATQTAQFGGAVEFAGTGRKNGSVTVGMSSWACEKGAWTGSTPCTTVMGAKFAWPVTLNINEVGPGNEVGALVKTVTSTFNMPYRPSQNNKQCKNEKGEADGAWYNSRTKECFHGKYFTIVFHMGKFVWPAKSIISVAYNTSDYGAEPQRPKPCDAEAAGCFYDSLNVGLTEPPEEKHPTAVPPSVGTDPLPEDAYQNTKYAPYYCDGGLGGTGTFRLDAGCWTGYQPLIEVKAAN